MSYTFYTREQVADVLARIGNKELAERYINNTTRLVVVTENPIKNSFVFQLSTEGFSFWDTISKVFDAAIASGEVSVVGKTFSEKKAREILEQDIKLNPLDFLKKDFLPATPTPASKDDEALTFIKKLLGISSDAFESDVSKEEDESDEDDDEDSEDTSSKEFAKEMAEYVVREAIKRSFIKTK